MNYDKLLELLNKREIAKVAYESVHKFAAGDNAKAFETVIVQTKEAMEAAEKEIDTFVLTGRGGE